MENSDSGQWPVTAKNNHQLPANSSSNRQPLAARENKLRKNACENEKFKFEKCFTILKNENQFSKIKETFPVKPKNGMRVYRNSKSQIRGCRHKVMGVARFRIMGPCYV